jgi:hypothetical protein
MAELPRSSRAEWIAARLQALGAPTSMIEHAQLGLYDDFNSKRPNRHGKVPVCAAIADLRNFFGAAFDRHCRVLRTSSCRGRWPVNQAMQGYDLSDRHRCPA